MHIRKVNESRRSNRDLRYLFYTRVLENVDTSLLTIYFILLFNYSFVADIIVDTRNYCNLIGIFNYCVTFHITQENYQSAPTHVMLGEKKATSSVGRIFTLISASLIPFWKKKQRLTRKMSFTACERSCTKIATPSSVKGVTLTNGRRGLWLYLPASWTWRYLFARGTLLLLYSWNDLQTISQTVKRIRADLLAAFRNYTLYIFLRTTSINRVQLFQYLSDLGNPMIRFIG